MSKLSSLQIALLRDVEWRGGVSFVDAGLHPVAYRYLVSGSSGCRESIPVWGHLDCLPRFGLTSLLGTARRETGHEMEQPGRRRPADNREARWPLDCR